ncbi:hypothetical protein [Kribbella antibiotica]|uniref:hypothetical protein n=1 Tax=Kribbella antibiotica TaxID=190195 RepID=UPI0014044E27|nr:hypothetical protein [Kribbella antibiotica]
MIEISAPASTSHGVPPGELRIDRYSHSARIDTIRTLLGNKQHLVNHLDTTLSEDDVAGNIENFVGAVPVPLALCGPLRISGSAAAGTFIAPMATLEGALAASYSRGAKMINESGGCETLTYDDYFLRSAQFQTGSLRESGELRRWITAHRSTITEIVRATGNHIAVTDLAVDCLGSTVTISIACSTGDAMGSNMVSKAIAAVARYVSQSNDLVHHAHFPLCEDKKNIPARTKGKKVIARTVLTAEVMQRLGRTTLHELDDYIRDAKDMLALNGATSLNVHGVNGMAALFQAFGQDMAYLGECSQLILSSRFISEGELEVTLTAPTIIVGTIGGGTGLSAYEATLEMVGCYGDGKAAKLAEIITAFMLAGEVSCLAALCSDEFVAAHETLGKNRPPG